ncbi:SRPBCC domain-containing protein [Kitasatospora kazusensis]|uniref:SRPBCC domain-containing protein n=1 Tax=Kitasatospora kazusensis TaxID=407974 RepID=A0ABN2ZYG2_9ACTN
MEHEVVVPLPAAVVQQALQDPALLARCVPGLSTDSVTDDGQETTGRLRVRIGTSTITYRGLLSLIPGREGVLTAFAEGEEARGSGEATATVRISLAPTEEEGASALRFTCDLSASGRLTDFDAATLATAGRRLLDRFAAALATEADGGEQPPATVVYLEDHAAANFGGDLDEDLDDLIAFSDDDLPGGRADADLPELTGFPELSEVPGIPDSPGDLGFGLRPDPSAGDQAEGPVRRSIVGRSAEEVDHAPPRGRYAPALPARSARARAATRWGGPEAGPVAGGPLGDRSAMPWVIGGGVALLGGAVVLVRALRRR